MESKRDPIGSSRFSVRCWFACGRGCDLRLAEHLRSQGRKDCLAEGLLWLGNDVMAVSSSHGEWLRTR